MITTSAPAPTICGQSQMAAFTPSATSPPYYGLRSCAGEQVMGYGRSSVYRLNEFTEPVAVEPMRCALGLEPSPVAYIGHLIRACASGGGCCDDGCIFVNLGDSYAGSGGAGGDVFIRWTARRSTQVEVTIPGR